ncbi:MAG: FAD-dependent oxidoreductase [Thermoplasmata archaeon]
MSQDELISEENKEAIRKAFSVLSRPVSLDVFIKARENDPFNDLTVALLSVFPKLSDKIMVNINDIGGDKSRRWNVSRSPSVLIEPELFNIRYTGAPLGEEARSLIQTILRVSMRESGLGARSKELLAGLKEKRHIRVFVTPTCPYCPGEVLNAFKCAIEKPDLVSAECVEALENPDLAREVHLGGVPQTVVNGVTVSKGLQTEERFVERVLSVKEWVEPTPAPRPASLEREVDLIVVGGGPAGLTAAMYAERSGLKTVVLEKRVVGGQVALTPAVENWPGFRNIPGAKLMELIGAQVRDYAEVIENEPVLELKVGRKIEALTPRGRYLGRAVILATGAEHRKLGVPGEERLAGRGVSYCATCDGFLYRGKRVAVVGGGNGALTDAIYLSSLGADVTIIHRRDKLRAQKRLQDLFAATKGTILWETVVEEIQGRERVESVRVKNLKSGAVTTIPVDAVFIAVGLVPSSQLAREIGVTVDENGFVKVDEAMRTNIPRVYAAGDVTGGVRQIVTAVGAGAVAALSAFDDLMEPYWRKGGKD